MGQQVWEMDSITGEHYTLGLYHGEDTGHVMIYMNNEIFLIDFNILESKIYQFFIGHEFMKLSITKKEQNFEYHLQVDTDSDTPLNSSIRKNEERDEYLLLAGLIVVSSILLVVFIYNYYGRYKS